MYCSLDDIKDQIGEETLIQLTDDEGLNEVHQGRVDRAISSAGSVINGYCGGRYRVPFADPAPDVIREMAAVMAISNLYRRRVSEMPEVWKDAYRQAVRQLEAMEKGTFSLGVDTACEAAPESYALTNLDENSQMFNRKKMEGF
jgi:phage gp36-like protein